MPRPDEWEELLKVARETPPPSFEIDGPPCLQCANWKPHIIFERGKYSGVQCCVAEEMFNDFSCHRKRTWGE
jgi:hypothetical protein